MSDIYIRIKALLDKMTEADLQKELDKIEKKLKPVKIKTDASDAEAKIKLFNSLQKIYKEEERQRLLQEKHAEKAQREREKLLQYEQRCRIAIEKTNKAIERRNFNFGVPVEGVNVANLTSQSSFLEFIKSRYGETAEIIGSFNEKQLKTGEIITQTSFRVRESNDKWRIYQATINKTDKELRVLDKGLRDVINRQITFGKALNIALTRIIQWGIATAAVYGTLRKIREGINYIVELDSKLTEIAIVTGASREETNKLAQEYLELAQKMRVSTKEIAEATVEFYRQGLSQKEVMERTKITTQYAKISSLEFGEAAEILTATINSMGVDAQRAADVFAYLGDATATGADEIGRAYQKVGGTAGALGLSFEKVASWIAVVSSRTRESAESIGTSFKTILARMQNLKEKGFNKEDGTSINQVAKALAQVGISLVDKRGQFRDFGIVMDELGKKWDSLDSKSRAYIATTVAGTHQQSRFLNLMEGYTESVKLYEQALQAAGTTQQKYNIWMEGLQAQINKVKSELEELYMVTINKKSLAKMFEISADVIDSLGNVIKTFGSLNTVLLTLVSIAALSKRELVVGTIKGLIAGTTTLSGVFASLSGVFASFLTNPLTLVIAGLGTLSLAIATICNDYQRYKEYVEKSTEAQKQFNDALNEITEKKNIEKINDAFEALEKLKEATNYDKNIESIQKLKEEIAKLNEFVDPEGAIRFTKYIQLKELEDKIKLVEDAAIQLGKTQEALDLDMSLVGIPKTIKEGEVGFGVSGGSGGSEKTPIPYEDLTEELIRSYNAQVEIDKLEAKILEKRIKLAESQKDYNRAISLTNDLIKNQQKTIDDLYIANEKILNAQKEITDRVKYNTEEWFDVNGEATVAYKELLNTFAGKTDEASKRAKKNIEDIFDKLYKLKRAWRENQEAIDLMNESIDTTRERLDAIIDKQLELVINDISKRINEIQKQQEETINSMEKALEAYKETQDEIIKKKEEELELLEEKYKLEEREKKLSEITAEIEKVKADTRFKIIDEATLTEIYTYDIEKVQKLEKQHKELVDEYEKQDIIKEKKKEIKALKEARDNYINIKQKEIQATKEANKTIIDNMKFFRDKIKEIQDMELIDLKNNLSAKLEELKKFTDLWNQYGSRISSVQTTVSNIYSSGSTSSSSSSSGSGGFSNGPVQITLPDGTVTTGERVGNTIYYAGTPVREAFEGRQVDWNPIDDSVTIHHEGLDSGFAGNIPFDSKTETIAKLLKGKEVILTKQQFDAIVPNVTRSIIPNLFKNKEMQHSVNNNTYITIKELVVNDFDEFRRQIQPYIVAVAR